MLFKCFACKADMVDTVNREVNSYIQSNISNGYAVDSKTVTVVAVGDSSLIYPTIVVSIWMVKVRKGND